MPQRIGESDVGDRPSSKWSGSYIIGAGLNASGSVAGGAHPNPFASGSALIAFDRRVLRPRRMMDQLGRHLRSPVQGVLRDHAHDRGRSGTHSSPVTLLHEHGSRTSYALRVPSNTLMACMSTAAPILP